MVKREKSNYLIQSVSHAIDVLEELARAGGEVGVTELSKRLKLHKNNVFRLLATLQLRGYVEQNRDTEDYSLSVKALQLGQAYIKGSKLVARATQAITALAQDTGETVSFAVLQSGQVQFPVSVESRQHVRVPARDGISFTAKSSAVGRLLTAQLPDSVLSEILTGSHPADAAIRSQLPELKQKGQIVDRGALEPEVVCVARIVRGYQNEIVGAIEVLVPQYRAKLDQLSSSVEAASAALSEALGNIRAPLTQTLSQTLEKSVVSTSSVSSVNPVSGDVAGNSSNKIGDTQI